VWEIYSIGDAEFLSDVLTGVALVAGTGDFRDLLRIGLLLGVLIVLFQSIRGGGLRIDGGALMVAFLIYGLAFAPRATVAVESVYTGTVRVVGNVPLGLAAVGSLVSKVGFGLTRLMETAFSTPAMTVQGYGTSLEVLKRVRLHGLTGPAALGSANSPVAGSDFTRSWVNYVNECTMPGIQIGALTEEGIRRSADFMGSLRFDAQVRMVEIFTGGPARTVECGPAHDQLRAFTLQVVLPAYQNVIFRVLNLSSAAQVDTAIGDALSALGAGGVSVTDFQVTALLAPVFDEALTQYFLETGRVAYATMVQQAVQQRAAQWMAQQSVFDSYIRPLLTILEGLGYAAMPILAILMVIGAFGAGLLMRYVQLLFWIQLWMPVLAVVNLYLHGVVTDGFEAIELGGSPLSSLAGMLQYDTVAARWLAVGGLVASATPVIAALLAFGATAGVVALANRMGTPENVNPGVGAMATVGNPMSRVAFGSLNSVDQVGGQRTTGAERVLPSFSFSRENTAAVETARSANQQALEAFRTALGRSVGTLFQSGESATEGTTASGGERASSSEAFRVAQLRLGGVADRLAQTFGITQSQALELAGRFAMGERVGPGANVGASTGVTLSQSQLAEANSMVQQQLAQDRTVAADLTRALANDWSRGQSTMALRQGSAAATEEISRAAEQVRSTSQSYSEAQSQREGTGVRETIGAVDAVSQILRNPRALERLQEAVTQSGVAMNAQRFASVHRDMAPYFGGQRGLDVFSQMMALRGATGHETGPLTTLQQQLGDRAVSEAIAMSVGSRWSSPVGAGLGEGSVAGGVGAPGSNLPGGLAGFEARHGARVGAAGAAVGAPPPANDVPGGFGRFTGEAEARGREIAQPTVAAIRSAEEAAARLRLNPSLMERVLSETAGVATTGGRAILNWATGGSLESIVRENTAWARSQGLTQAQAEYYGLRSSFATPTPFEGGLSRLASLSPAFQNWWRGEQLQLEAAVREEAERMGMNPNQVVGLLSQAARETRDQGLDELRQVSGMNQRRSDSAPSVLQDGLRNPPPSPDQRSDAGAAATSAFRWAQSQIGRGEAQMAGALRLAGAGLDPTREPWCAAFVNTALGQAGLSGTGSNVATSFRTWGSAVGDPRAVAAGDVLVEHRGLPPGRTGGHVGFATGETRVVDGRLQLQMLSGNDDDRVGLSWRDAAGLDVRRAPSNRT
jgi:hypothetical protein